MSVLQRAMIQLFFPKKILIDIYIFGCSQNGFSSQNKVKSSGFTLLCEHFAALVNIFMLTMNQMTVQCEMSNVKCCS